MKKMFFLAAIFFSIPGIFAVGALTQTVDAKIPLNENLTIYANYSGGDFSDTNSLCAFYILHNGILVKRLTDEYLSIDGTVSAEYKLTEPLFRRGNDYNVLTKCVDANATSKFYVEQKEDIAFGVMPQSMAMELKFWTDPANSVTVFLIALLAIIAAVILLGSATR